MVLLNIVSGSYEGSLFGFESKISTENKMDGDNKVNSNTEDLITEMIFGFHCSQGSLKSLGISNSGQYLACGGTDEVVRIFNMNTRKSTTELSTIHKGTITCLQFYKESFLLSASEDCNICIWRVQDWECLHILGGHKKTINDISIHPSGKMVLSVSKDNTLKLWNLIEGRIAFTRRLKGTAEGVEWDESGMFYLLYTRTEIFIHSAQNNEKISELKYDSRINKVCFLHSYNKEGDKDPSSYSFRIACVTDDRMISIYDYDDTTSATSTSSSKINLIESSQEGQGEVINRIEVPEDIGRPRDVFVTSGSDGKEYVAIVTSSGQMFVLDNNVLDPSLVFEDMLCASYKIPVGPRLTCVTAWAPQAVDDSDIKTKTNTNTNGAKKKKKRKKKNKDKGKEEEKEVERKKTIRFADSDDEYSVDVQKEEVLMRDGEKEVKKIEKKVRKSTISTTTGTMKKTKALKASESKTKVKTKGISIVNKKNR